MAFEFGKYGGISVEGILASKPEEMEKIINSTLNRTARQAYTFARRRVTKIYNISQTDWNYYARLKLSSVYNETIYLDIKTRSKEYYLPLFVFKPKIKFIYKTTKKGKKRKYTGVTVKVKKTGPRKLVESGFVGIMPNSLVSIFKREENWEHRFPRQRAEKTIHRYKSMGQGRKKKYLGTTTISAYGKKHGLPIERLYTVNVPRMFTKEGESGLIEYVEDNITRIFDNQLKYLLSR